mgnify:CR=1 FL=1
MQTPYPLADAVRRADGSSRFAYVTLLMLNDNYLPGVLTLAYGLRRQKTQADLVCLITSEITAEARYALGLLYLQAQNNAAGAGQLSRLGNNGFVSRYFDFAIDTDKLANEPHKYHAL